MSLFLDVYGNTHQSLSQLFGIVPLWFSQSRLTIHACHTE